MSHLDKFVSTGQHYTSQVDTTFKLHNCHPGVLVMQVHGDDTVMCCIVVLKA